MRPLLFFLSTICLVSSSSNWEALIIRASPTDCSVCKLSEAAFSQQIPDSLFSGLSSKCDLLPSQFRTICETGLSKIIHYAKEGLQSRIPDCSLPCVHPSPISTTHFCSLLHPAFNSLDGLFVDITETLIPTLCLSQENHHACTKQIVGLLKVAKMPVSNLFMRVGVLLECKEFKTAEPSKLGADWTSHDAICTACQISLKGISLVMSEQGTTHIVDAVHNTFHSACLRITDDNSTLLEGPPTCNEAASMLVQQLKQDEKANDRLCQIAYDCSPLRTDNKDEL